MSVAARAAGRAYAAVMDLPERPLRWLQWRLGPTGFAWLLLVPNLAVFSLFAFLPIAINFVYALTGGTELLPSDRHFVGLANLRDLLGCRNFLDPNTCTRDLFWTGVWNSLWFVVLQVGLMILLSLLTALVLNRQTTGRGLFRAAFFYPVLLSPVVVALIWKWILQRYGLLNAAVQAAGGQQVDWLLSAPSAFSWTVFVSIWAHMGFYTLILLAGLQSIPADIYEAALMDSASAWRTFRRITLPLLMPSLLVVLVLGLIRAVQVFDEVYVLTGGGPGTATTYLVQFIYQTGFAAQIREYGIASAASLLLAAVLLVLTLAQLRLMRRTHGG